MKRALSQQLNYSCPMQQQNYTDSIFNKSLIINMTDSENGKRGSFNFILNTNL
jgi:hypothetical protein